MNRRLAVRFTWPLPVCSSVSVFTVQSAINRESVSQWLIFGQLAPSSQVVEEFWWKATSHVVPLLMTEWSVLPRTPQQRLPVLFDGLDNARGDLDPRVICGFLGPPESAHKWYFDRFSRFNRFETANVTFKVTQWYWYWCLSTGQIWFPISLPLQLCLFLTFSRYYQIFPKI